MQPGTRVITQLNMTRANDIQQPVASSPTVPSKSSSHQNQKTYSQNPHHQTHSHSIHNSEHSLYHQNQQNQYETVNNRYGTTATTQTVLHQSRNNDNAKIPKSKPPNEQIYTRAADRNYHYQQQHNQQTLPATSNQDGKSTILLCIINKFLGRFDIAFTKSIQKKNQIFPFQ